MNTKPTISLADYIDRLKKAKISVDSEDTGSFNETGCEMRTLYVSNQIRENGISIGYTMYFSHPEGKPHLLSDPEEGQEGAWFESSFAFDVLDEDGEDDDLLDEDVLFSLAAEHTKITDLVVPPHILGTEQIVDLTVSQGDYDVVERSNDLDIHHQGELIGEAEDDGRYRCNTLRIYKLADGTFVTEMISIAKFTSDTFDDRNWYDGEHCANEREVAESFLKRPKPWDLDGFITQADIDLGIEVLEDAGIEVPDDLLADQD